MQSIYRDIQKKALKIASGFPPPVFYRDFKYACESSRVFFDTDPIIANLKKYVESTIENDFGHGMDHVVKVTLDAGALLLIEGKNSGFKENIIHRSMLITQSAGLLHDIKRKEKEHALQGSIFVKDLLKSYPFTPGEILDISMAIKNHEAFKPVDPLNSPEGNLVSDCLYDADKFRWGPDNFTHTVWDMLAYSKTPIKNFIDYYPKSIEGLVKIKETFRTPTGKKYGPRFIDLGIEMGEWILADLKETFV
ncbi:MAG: hypothetical protein KKB94_07995 [Proteobacteria bacterium]|nr:hypothetical protein [Pseudomonadota bacterium]